MANPINAFLITKRLTNDWKDIEALIGRDLEEEINSLTKDLELPDEQVLNGAAVGLNRLKQTYNLNISDLIKGEINGINFGYTYFNFPILRRIDKITCFSSALSASDCFVIGVELNLNLDYHNSVLWLKEALNRFEPGHIHQNAQIYRFLANSLYAIGKSLQ